jgi:DNA mismatch endonuclease (patch repair protein)
MDRVSPERRSAIMRKVRTRNTGPELLVRGMIFRLGYRFRLHDPLLPGRPDLTGRGRRKAIFVHGCFWHGHPQCQYARIPKSNIVYWRTKIRRNRARDRQTAKALYHLGWEVLEIWQCETRDTEKLAAKLIEFLGSPHRTL